MKLIWIRVFKLKQTFLEYFGKFLDVKNLFLMKKHRCYSATSWSSPQFNLSLHGLFLLSSFLQRVWSKEWKTTHFGVVWLNKFLHFKTITTNSMTPSPVLEWKWLHFENFFLWRQRNLKPCLEISLSCGESSQFLFIDCTVRKCTSCFVVQILNYFCF